jgi:hypothetical protein
MRNNMNAACCLHPSHNNNRSLSPNPDEPARPSPLALDSIFAMAALPGDHPHALKLDLPAPAAEDEDQHGLPVPKLRRVKKSPSSFGLVNSGLVGSGLVHRVGKRLRRRATFGGGGAAEGGIGENLLESGVGSSLRDEARFDTDAKRLSSGEVLGAVGGEEDDDGPTASTSGFMRTAASGDGHEDGDLPMLTLREL